MNQSAIQFDQLLRDWDSGYVPDMGFFAVLIECLHDLDVESLMPRVPMKARPGVLQWAMGLRAAYRSGETLLAFTSSGHLRDSPRGDVIEKLGDWLDQHSDEWVARD